MSNHYYANSRPPVTRIPVDRSVLPIPRNAGHSVLLRGLTGSNIDYIQIPGIVPGQTFSFGIWFKMFGANAFQRVISCKTVGGGGFDVSQNNGTNKILFSGSNASGSTVISLAPTTQFNFGDWVHLGIRCAPNNTAMFINGVKVATNTTATIGLSSGQVLTLGRASFTNGSNLNGQLAGFVIANNVAWSDSTITALFNGTIPSAPDCVLGFYEDRGAICFDSSGKGNNGNLTGVTTYLGRLSDTPASWPAAGRFIFA